MVAGEPSGDLLAGLLLDGLHTRWPDLQAAGIGGPQMSQRGFSAWWASDKLAVRGYAEVLRHYWQIVSIRRQLKARLLDWRPDVFIGVDAPDFNLPLHAQLKARGTKTVHFICPAVWAWRAKRVVQIRRSIDHVLCIFPFETALLAEHGIASTYIGHPLAQVIPMRSDKELARQALGLHGRGPVVALLPGSRQAEIHYLADRFFQAAALMKWDNPDIEFLVPAAPGLKRQVEEAVCRAAMGGSVRVLQGQSHLALAACDATLIASGTATLEAALFKRPMVIAYNMHELSWQIMRRKKLQPWVGLPNILCADSVVPELLQDQATPRALADAMLLWLEAGVRAPQKIHALEQRFTVLHQQLQRDTFGLASDAIARVIAA